MNFLKKRKVTLSNSTTVSYDTVRKVIAWIIESDNFQIEHMYITLQDTSVSKSDPHLEVTVAADLRRGIVILPNVSVTFLLHKPFSNNSLWRLENKSDIKVKFYPGSNHEKNVYLTYEDDIIIPEEKISITDNWDVTAWSLKEIRGWML